jgi:hypothetical protein
MTKNKFKKLKRDVKKALYYNTMVDQWDELKGILNDYYFNHLANEKERQKVIFAGLKKMGKILRGCDNDNNIKLDDGKNEWDL